MSDTSLPESIGLSTERLERAYRLLAVAVERGELPAAALLVARHGVALPARAFGRLRLDGASPAARPDTIFLVASVTKPVAVAGAMLLVERGQLTLDDPVCAHIPEFAENGKEGVLVRHLMTHTSGLPDMLPENYDLRREHAPLSEFARRVCRLALEFEPGTRIQYQSMGILILAQIAERIAGMPFPEFLRQELFAPLSMSDTSLGVGPLNTERIAHVNVPEEMRGTDWGWNTPYWWGLGAPWGGMFSTVSDIWRFLQMFLNGGRFAGVQVLGRATAEAMVRDQTGAMPELPPAERKVQSWGLGWRRFPFGSTFGDLLSPLAFGHSGATGTVVWADPARELACALFTTEPSANSRRLLGRCSNAVAAAAL
ncbi:MAG: beta-lactamase family protein [Chloroflexi bacterium]|nr:beta-lactamase family protein [Chloroflexota bacterium]